MPAVSWHKADHAYGPILAVSLVVEVDVFLTIYACCGSGELGIRGASNARFAVQVFHLAQCASLPFTVFINDVMENVVVVHIDQVSSLLNGRRRQRGEHLGCVRLNLLVLFAIVFLVADGQSNVCLIVSRIDIGVLFFRRYFAGQFNQLSMVSLNVAVDV